MKKSQYIKQKRIQQRNIEMATCKNLIWHIIIVIIIMFIALYNMSKTIDEKEYTSKKASEFYSNKTTVHYMSNLTTFKSQIKEESSKVEVDYCHAFTCNKDWSAKESYLLAKIAMAEAEGCNTKTKTLIIMCVLNRVESDEFPDTIEEVILQQCANGTYQFSPIGNGRWDSVEPNEDCYEAIEAVKKSTYDYSGGALYFENCTDEDNWHSRNLEYLYESEGIRFYK